MLETAGKEDPPLKPLLRLATKRSPLLPFLKSPLPNPFWRKLLCKTAKLLYKLQNCKTLNHFWNRHYQTLSEENFSANCKTLNHFWNRHYQNFSGENFSANCKTRCVTYSADKRQMDNCGAFLAQVIGRVWELIIAITYRIIYQVISNQ